MKIVQVCTGYPPDREGGIESLVSALTKQLKARGHHVSVITRFWFRKIEDKTAIQYKTPEGEAKGYLAFALRALLKILSLQPDVVHCHGLEGAILCTLLGHLHYRTVLHLHNSLSREEGFYHPFRHRIGYQVLREACMAADLIVCPTQVVKYDVMEHLPSMSSSKICVVPNSALGTCYWPMEKVDELRRQMGLENKKVLLYFGKIKRSKGLEGICKAFYHLKRGNNLCLVLAGSATRTDNFLRYLRRNYPEVILTGFVDDPAPYYQLADLYCIYTDGFDGGETFAVSLAEAMVKEVPIICSENPVYREVTRGNAFFVPPREPEQLASSIEFALSNPEIAKTNAARAKKIADNLYSVNAFASGIEEVYYQLVNGQGPQARRRGTNIIHVK